MMKADATSSGFKEWVGAEEVEVANIEFPSRNVSVNGGIYDNLRNSRLKGRLFG